MKKIFIFAVIALFGVSVASCQCGRTESEAQEEVVEVVDTTAVEAPADSTLVAE